MGLLGFLGRRPPVRTLADLADFIDQNAAFLMQKGIYEYSRARAGHYAKVLFSEPGFRDAVEEARWRAYPLGLVMVGEMVDATLRPHSAHAPQDLSAALTRLVTSVFDRYPVPAILGETSWLQRREELVRLLAQVSLHAPKRVIDIPEQFAKQYFSLMPIHEKLRGRDYPTTRNYLRVSLCNIHSELTKRMDARAMAALLSGGEARQQTGTE